MESLQQVLLLTHSNQCGEKRVLLSEKDTTLNIPTYEGFGLVFAFGFTSLCHWVPEYGFCWGQVLHCTYTPHNIFSF